METDIKLMVKKGVVSGLEGLSKEHLCNRLHLAHVRSALSFGYWCLGLCV